MKRKNTVGKRAWIAALTAAVLLAGNARITPAATGETASEEELTGGRNVPHYDLNTDGGTWKAGEDGKMRYYEADGTLVTESFFCDGTYTYYLQNDGTPMTNRLTYHPDGEHLIYFDAQGHELFDKFQYCEDVQYICYFNTFGYAYFDEVTFSDGGAYYLNATGKMENEGWFQFANGKDYGFANEDGTLMTGGFSYNPYGQVVYYNWNGTVARNLISDGAWYYEMDGTDGHLVGQFPVSGYSSGTTSHEILEEDPEVPLFYPGQTWTVEGEWAVSFNGASLHTACNPYATSYPQIVMVSYNYTNLGWGSDFILDYYRWYDVYDQQGSFEWLYDCACPERNLPQKIDEGQTFTDAQQVFGISSMSDYIVIQVVKADSAGIERKANFLLPIQR